VFLASGLDHPGKDFDSLATALNRRAALTVLLITDAFERAAPAGAYPFATGKGGIRWASFGRAGKGGDGRREGNAAGGVDRRIAHLHRLGIAAIPIDASAIPEVVAENLDRLDGRAF
jgi:hypothetical protein